MLGLLHNLDRLVTFVQAYHAVALRIVDVIAKDRRTALPRDCELEMFGKAVPEKQIVTENQAARFAGEKVPADVKGLRDPLGTRLGSIAKRKPEHFSVAKQTSEQTDLIGPRNDENIANSGEHQHGNRIIDHRLVIDRQQVFVDNKRCRIKPRSVTAGEHNSLHDGDSVSA